MGPSASHATFCAAKFLTSTCISLVVSTDAEVATESLLHAFATCSAPCSHSSCMYSAGITGLSAVEGNLVLAGVTGFLAAFLAFQVIQPHLYVELYYLQATCVSTTV